MLDISNLSLEEMKEKVAEYRGVGSIAEQYQLCQEILKSKPDDILTLYILNTYLLPCNRYSEAYENLKRTIKINGYHFYVLLMYAEYYSGTMQFKKALKYYSKLYEFLIQQKETPALFSLLSEVSYYFLCVKNEKKAREFAEAAEQYNTDHHENEVLKEINRTATYGCHDFPFSINSTTYGYLNYETTTKDVGFRARLYLAAMQSLIKKNIKPLRKEIKRIRRNGRHGLPTGLMESVSGRVKFLLGQKDEGVHEMRKGVELNSSLITISNLLGCLTSRGEDNETDTLTRRLMSILYNEPLTDFDHIFILTSKITRKYAGEWYEFYTNTKEDIKDYHEYSFNLGRCCYFSGDYNRALEFYKQTRDNVVVNPYYISWEESRCYHAMGEDYKSEQLFAQARIENPDLDFDRSVVLDNE